jgi:hypothetical protein
VDVDGVADVSDVHAAFIFRVEACKVGDHLIYTGFFQKHYFPLPLLFL